MTRQDLFARQLPFGPSLTEAGWTSLIELECLASERLLLAGLYNNIADFIKHRKISIFRKIELGYVTELRYNTLEEGYAVFNGGYYMLNKNILVVA